MICQSCKKNNASIHFTKITNGHVEEMHLCDICAKENKDVDFDFPLSFQKIFTGLIASMEENKEEIKDTVCSQCGLTYKHFLDIGKFGCSKCYETFKDDVELLLKGIHGHNEHRGKIPSRANQKALQQRTIKNLKIELDKSIEREDFEKAAYLRDEIKKVREGIDS